MSWSDDAEKMDVTLEGNVTFNEALTDVESLSDGGYLKIREWVLLVPHTIEITSRGGALDHSYYIAGMRRPWDADAQRRMAVLIARAVHRGIGAESRTRSILAKRGVPGVLEEIDRLETDYARRVYVQALVTYAALDAAGAVPVLQKIRDRITRSDFERRQALETIAERVKLDEPAAAAYVAALDTMRSDFERRQALTALLTSAAGQPGVADRAMAATARMNSDFERRQVFTAALSAGSKLERIETILPSLNSMRSDFEKRQVLVGLIESGDLSIQARSGVLDAAVKMSSDFERRQVLVAFVNAYDVEPATTASFFRAVSAMRSDFERAETLLTLAGSQALDATMRAALVDAADAMRSDHEQNRVLAQLVRAERR